MQSYFREDNVQISVMYQYMNNQLHDFPLFRKAAEAGIDLMCLQKIERRKSYSLAYLIKCICIFCMS